MQEACPVLCKAGNYTLNFTVACKEIYKCMKFSKQTLATFW